jgi:hypothetical protein
MCANLKGEFVNKRKIADYVRNLIILHLVFAEMWLYAPDHRQLLD